MLNLDSFIFSLNSFPTEFISFLVFIFGLLSLLAFLKFFSKLGLFVFLTLAVIIGNIQVLKAVKFYILDEPVALGTILFSLTYLCTDILTEYYGENIAKKAVWISFSGMLFVSVIMILTIGWQPLSTNEFGSSYDSFRNSHNAMETLFLPAPAIFVSSLIAYIVSQYNDIWIFKTLKILFKNKFVGFRSFFSTSISALLDSIIFSVLAWVVFAQEKIEISVLIYTYILGTFGLRLFLAALNAPIVNFAKYFLPRDSNE